MTRDPAEAPRESGTDPLAWRGPVTALGLVVRGRTARTAIPCSVLVGTVLTAVNQGQTIVSGPMGLSTIVRVVVNYAVPYLVSSWGCLSGHRVHHRGNIPGGSGVPKS